MLPEDVLSVIQEIDPDTSHYTYDGWTITRESGLYFSWAPEGLTLGNQGSEIQKSITPEMVRDLMLWDTGKGDRPVWFLDESEDRNGVQPK